MTRATATFRAQPRSLCPRVLPKYCVPQMPRQFGGGGRYHLYSASGVSWKGVTAPSRLRHKYHVATVDTEQRLRGQGVRLIESQEAHHNGPCSFAAELLIDNRSAQHHQWLQVARLQSTRSTAHDNLAQDRIYLLEMGESFSVG